MSPYWHALSLHEALPIPPGNCDRYRREGEHLVLQAASLHPDGGARGQPVVVGAHLTGRLERLHGPVTVDANGDGGAVTVVHRPAGGALHDDREVPAVVGGPVEWPPAVGAGADALAVADVEPDQKLAVQAAGHHVPGVARDPPRPQPRAVG